MLMPCIDFGEIFERAPNAAVDASGQVIPNDTF
jgi:hypothetical protein